MTRMIVLLSVVIVLFAAAAAGSWYLQTQHAKDKDADAAKVVEEKPKKPAASAASKSANTEAAQRVVSRTAPALETDRLTQMAATLHQQQEAIKVREQQAVVREKQMDIIHEEVKKEQKRLDAVRKEIQAEIALLQEKIEMLEKRSAEGRDERKALDIQKKDLERVTLEVENQEWNNLKQQVKTIEKMDPEAASVVVVQMVDQGKMDTAVKILSQVKDRQAAAIFAEIAKQDTKLPGQLFERMLTIKTPQIAAPKQGN